MKDEKHLCKVRGEVFRGDWECLSGNKAAVFWFTGLSGSGKSTIAHEIEKKLFQAGCRVKVFDGDNIRHGLCGDLSFSPEARAENTRRIAEVAKLFVENGIICLCAFISPLRSDREQVRRILGNDDYHEIYSACSVEECERRDIKGYYKLAREGKIQNYTGISAPFEEPENPDVMLKTDKESLEQCVETVLAYLKTVTGIKGV